MSGTLTYWPSNNGTIYGYFPAVNGRTYVDTLPSHNNAVFLAGFEYKLRFSVLRISEAHMSVLHVQLRGMRTRKAVAHSSITGLSFSAASNVVQVEVSGVVTASSPQVRDKLEVLVSAVGAGGPSFAISQIEVSAMPV